MNNPANINETALRATLEAQNVLLMALVLTHPNQAALKTEFARMISAELEDPEWQESPQAYTVLRSYEEAVLAVLSARPSPPL